MSNTFQNPIIPGFNPDPSICRVGDTFYLVTSSFEFFPGVPIYQSNDLVHWEQIGHCLTRKSQLPLEKCHNMGGIFAPTIRWHQGLFYMITTNVTAGGHFYVTTENPSGEWSEPIWVDAPGIDPSLFFDEDGQTYFLCTCDKTGENGIHMARIDVATGKLLEPLRLIWTGTGGRYPEGPHLYFVQGMYYLMIAEGGTEYGHYVVISRSHSPWGPFENCPKNPILTHRDAPQNPIQGTGHADMVQAPDGSWWMVFLAMREASTIFWERFILLGRETFLTPMTWDDAGWPVVNGGEPVQIEMPLPALCNASSSVSAIADDFQEAKLNAHWNFLRNPVAESWSLTERPGYLRLNGLATKLGDQDAIALLCRRQEQLLFQAQTQMEFQPQQDGEEAGLVIYLDDTHHYALLVVRRNGENRLILRRVIGDIYMETVNLPWTNEKVILQVSCQKTVYAFSAGVDRNSMIDLGTCSAKLMSNMQGILMGLYASGSGKTSTVPADFQGFSYQTSL